MFTQEVVAAAVVVVAESNYTGDSQGTNDSCYSSISPSTTAAEVKVSK